MIAEILSLISVLLFCACSYFFLKSIIQPIPLVSTERKFAFQAMRLEKYYRVFSWGMMTIVFLMGVIASFVEVYRGISFS